jgi:phosphoribosyl 1,2-cyclic phosphate phosphodiesterase
MRFTFLGTGTSAGIPMIACVCPVCTSPDPRDSRLRTAASLEWTDANGKPRVLLLDAGPDLRVQAMRANLQRCDAIVLTHNHVDHCFGLDEVRRFNAVQRSPIDLFADEHTMASVRRIYTHILDREKNINDSFVATLIPFTISQHAIDAGTPLELFGVLATPLRLLHGKLPILGYRFDLAPTAPDALRAAAQSILPLAYCTDVSGVPPQTFARLRGLRTLVLDCLRERAHPTHLRLDDAVSLAHDIDAEATYFVHMSHELPHASTQAQLPPRMTLAHDGLTLQ